MAEEVTTGEESRDGATPTEAASESKEPKGAEETKTSMNDEYATFAEAHVDEQGNLTPFTDKVFARVEDDSNSELREIYYNQTGESRTEDYLPQLAFLEDATRAPASEDGGFEWYDEVSEGAKRAVNRFVRTMNEHTDLDLQEINEIRSLDDSGLVDTVDHFGLPIVAGVGTLAAAATAPGWLTMLGAGGAVNALAYGAHTLTYLNEEDVKDLNKHDFIVSDLLDREGLLPETPEEMAELSYTEVALRAWLAETMTVFTVGGVFKLGGKTFRTLKGKGAKEALNKTKNKVLTSAAEVEDEVRKLKQRALYPESMDGVRNKTLTATQESAVEEIDKAKSFRQLGNNPKVLKAYREAKIMMESGDTATRIKTEISGAYKEVDDFLSVSKVPELGGESRVVNYDERAGAALSSLLRSTNEKSVGNALDSFSHSAAQAIKKTKGVGKVGQPFSRTEQIALEQTQDFSKRYGQHGDFTAGEVRSMVDAHETLTKRKMDLLMKDPSSPLIPKYDQALRFNEARKKILSTRAGGSLEGFKNWQGYSRSITEIEELIQDQIRNGAYKKARKTMVKYTKIMGELKEGAPKRGFGWMNQLAQVRTDNLLGRGALEAAAASNLFTAGYELAAYHTLKIYNPLPALRHGLWRGLKQGFKEVTSPGKFVKEAVGSHAQKDYRFSTKADWKPKSAAGKALKLSYSTARQMMKSVDRVSTELTYHMDSSRALDDILADFQKKGDFAGLKQELKRAVTNDVPTDVMQKWKLRHKLHSDRIMFRARTGRHTSPLATLGWAVDDIVQAGLESRNPALVGATSIIGIFSNVFANSIDFISRNTMLGVKIGLKPVDKRQLLGTAIGMGSINTILEDRLVLSGVGPSERAKFKRFGGQEGLMLGDKLVPFHHMGGFGEVIRVHAKGMQVLNYATQDMTELPEFQRLTTAFGDLLTYLATDSWLGRGLPQFVRAMTTSQSVDMEEIGYERLKDAAIEFVPGNSFIDRIATMIEGRSLSKEGKLAVQNLSDALQSFEGVEQRDAFGVPFTRGEINGDLSRQFTDWGDQAILFFNPVKRGPSPKSNKLRMYMAQSGMFTGRASILLKNQKELSLSSDTPGYFDTKISPLRRKLSGGFFIHNLSWEGTQIYRGMISLDRELATKKIDELTEYYKSSATHTGNLGGQVRTNAMSALSQMREIVGKGGALDGFVNTFYGRREEGTRMEDVLYKIALEPISSMPPGLRDDIQDTARAFHNDLRARNFGRKNDMNDEEVKELTIRLARNTFIKKFYKGVVDIMEGVMTWTPEMDDARLEAIDKQGLEGYGQ